jgi:hypothetical protein
LFSNFQLCSTPINWVIILVARRSYYKCTGSRCGAKKHVEKSVDDPDMLIVTYEGLHLHGPPPPFPRRHWASADFLSGAVASGRKAEAPSAAAAAPSQTGTHVNQLHTCYAGAAKARDIIVAGEMCDRQNGPAEDYAVNVTATWSCDGGSSASVAKPRDGTALPCDSPPTTWSCPDFYYSWSPEALLP